MTRLRSPPRGNTAEWNRPAPPGEATRLGRFLKVRELEKQKARQQLDAFREAHDTFLAQTCQKLQDERRTLCEV